MSEKVNLEELKKAIGKNLRGTHISVLSKSDIATTKEWLATPSYDLNRILSGSLKKGIPNKTLTMFIGPEMSGKSSFMALCLKNAQARGYTPVVIDTEGSWTSDFVERWGIDPNELMYIYTPWIDQICVALGNIIESKQEKLAIVIDSVGGTERMKLVDDAVGEGQLKTDQGLLQRELKKMLKMLLYISKSRSSFALISGHYYGSPGTYGTAEEVGGGKFMKLAPDIIVSLKKTKILGENKKIVGNKINAVTSKNRYYPPFNEAEISINFIDGIDKWAGILDLCIKAEQVTQNGSWYIIGDEKVHGGENAKEAIKSVDGIIDKLDTWLRRTGYSTVNESLKEAEELINEDEDTENNGNGDRKKKKGKNK